MADTPLSILLLAIATILCALAFIVSLASETRWFSATPNSHLANFADALQAVVGFGVEGFLATPIANAGYLLQVLVVLLGVMAPALLIGAVAFKVFVRPNRLHFTEWLTHLEHPVHGNVFGFRVYNTSKLLTTDLRFTAFARVVRADDTSVLRNIPLEVVESRSLWPVADYHSPNIILLRVPREASNFEEATASIVRKLRHAGDDPGIFDDADWIVVTVTGRLPQLGTELHQLKWYSLSKDLYANHPIGSVKVDFTRRTKSTDWEGWEVFDRPPSSSE